MGNTASNSETLEVNLIFDREDWVNRRKEKEKYFIILSVFHLELKLIANARPFCNQLWE